MAHGTTQNTSAYFVKLLGLKEKKPVFQITHKVDDEYKHEDCSFIEGNFDKIETGTYEWEGKPRDIFKLHLTDGAEKYILNFSYTALSRSLLNSLCGAKEIGKLKIEVWGYVKEGIAKNAIKVLNNGVKAERALTYDATQLMVDIIKNKKDEYVSSDYSALDKFLTDKFEEINKKRVEVKEEKTVGEKLIEKSKQDSSDNLPF